MAQWFYGRLTTLTKLPLPVVPLPHAVVEPHTVVIKATNTLVAGPTVLGFGAPDSKKGTLTSMQVKRSMAVLTAELASSLVGMFKLAT